MEPIKVLRRVGIQLYFLQNYISGYELPFSHEKARREVLSNLARAYKLFQKRFWWTLDDPAYDNLVEGISPREYGIPIRRRRMPGIRMLQERRIKNHLSLENSNLLKAHLDYFLKQDYRLLEEQVKIGREAWLMAISGLDNPCNQEAFEARQRQILEDRLQILSGLKASDVRKRIQRLVN